MRSAVPSELIPANKKFRYSRHYIIELEAIQTNPKLERNIQRKLPICNRSVPQVSKLPFVPSSVKSSSASSDIPVHIDFALSNDVLFEDTTSVPMND